MRDIYREAKQVLIWLGEASVMEDGALRVLPNLITLMEKCISDGHLLDPRLPDTFESIGLPTPSHPVWKALGAIMTRSWFRRLWTLQEAVLPVETSLIVLCGSQRLRWDMLEAFVAVMFERRLASWTVTGDVRISTVYLNGYVSVQMIRACKDSFENHKQGIPLDTLLHATRKREVTKAADMVFGILALMPHGAQKWITIDTTSSVEKVYVEFAKFYILNERDECLLNHTSSITHRKDLPSWCPDFSTSESTVPICTRFWSCFRTSDTAWSGAFRAGFKITGPWQKPMKKNWEWITAKNGLHRRRYLQGMSDTSHPGYISFVPDKTQIRANGALVDTVAELFRPNDELSQGAGAWDDHYYALRTLQWEKECLMLARKALKVDQQVPDIYVRTLIANLSWESGGNENTWDEHDMHDVSAAYLGFLTTLTSIVETKGNATVAQEMNGWTRGFITEFHRMTRNRCFFSTVGGRIGLGPSDTQPGDDVCIIFFCPTPYILRREQNLSKLIGDSYVHEFMYRQALDLIDEGKLDRAQFVIG